jgi:predicted alpha/beta hydrolase family esterase
MSGTTETPLTKKQQAEADRAEALRLNAEAEADDPNPAAVATHTADPSGVEAAVAYGARVEAAHFTLRELGHIEIDRLIDDLYAGVQKLEAGDV